MCWWKVSGQLQERRAGGREFQILGDVTEKLRAPKAMRANGTVSRLVLGVAGSTLLRYCCGNSVRLSVTLVIHA